MSALRWMAAALGLLAAGRLAGTGRRSPAPRPLARAYWYWHHPFRLSPAEQAALERARIERLYVHAGTLAAGPRGLRLTARQEWPGAAPVPAVAVLRVRPEALAALLGPGGASAAAACARAARLPSGVLGVQWDADVPTRRLPEYARFLREVRAALPPGWLLSATALPDWLRASAYREVAAALDEVAPQFYGSRWPEREAPPLWETEGLPRQVHRAAAGRARVWVGLPAYGRCVGRAGGSWRIRHDVDPHALLEDPAWELRPSHTRLAALGAVEDSLALACAEPAAAGPLECPAGTTLWFQWPRAEGLRAAEAALRREALPGVAGVCFFRWPVPGEPLAMDPVPPPEAPLDAPKLALRRAGDTVRLWAAGGEGPRLPEGLELEVRPAGGTLQTNEEVVWYRGELPAGPARADRARLRLPLLRPGRTWEATVQSPHGPVTATLTWTDAAGSLRRTTSGTLP